MKNHFGQFMTPHNLAQIVAKELGKCDTVIDFAIGEGALVCAVQLKMAHTTKVIGFDIDEEMIQKSASLLNEPQLKVADGLTVRLALGLLGRIGVVGNPPYLGSTTVGLRWVSKAFPNLVGKSGTERAEIQFLARALVTAKKTGGRIVFVMPISFADGDTYRHIRKELVQNYHLVRCIEIPSGTFNGTEARTIILVIDTKKTDVRETEICVWDADNEELQLILKSEIKAGCRLDAKFHAFDGEKRQIPQLKDLNICIDRGRFSRKEAEKQNIVALHTSHLGLAKNRKLIAPSTKNTHNSLITAKKGDILLSRTGKRVCWDPILVESGESLITDHVFRIRIPKASQAIVYESFWHPDFPLWLTATSKGVCATVLTKRELLEMPVFAWI